MISQVATAVATGRFYLIISIMGGDSCPSGYHCPRLSVNFARFVLKFDQSETIFNNIFVFSIINRIENNVDSTFHWFSSINWMKHWKVRLINCLYTGPNLADLNQSFDIYGSLNSFRYMMYDMTHHHDDKIQVQRGSKTNVSQRFVPQINYHIDSAIWFFHNIHRIGC